MKFVAAFAGLVVMALAGVWAGRRLKDGPRRDPGVEANARLTGYAGMVLLVPLGVEVLTGVRPGLLAHALIGFLLVPLVLLKLGSTGYRFLRYYTGSPDYRAAGPPELLMRLLGPLVVLLTIAVFATGIELWLFGYRFGDQWLSWHKAAFVAWFFAITVHVVAYWSRAPALALADSSQRLDGALTRRSLVVGSLLLGCLMAIAMLPFPSPFTPLAGAG